MANRNFIQALTGGHKEGRLDLATDATCVVCMTIDTSGEAAINTDPTVPTTHFLAEDGLAGKPGVLMHGDDMYRTNSYAGTPTEGQWLKCGADGKLTAVASGVWDSTHFLLGIVTKAEGGFMEFTTQTGSLGS